MLKAYIINKDGERAIYYKDNPYRTISLENCLKRVFTNDKTPARQNLLKIIELRNTSTHFVTEEYEMVYIPLFQACVLNYVEKMHEFHDVDITAIIPKNFLNLVITMEALDENKIRAKYPDEIAQRIIKTNHELSPMIEQGNHGFAIKIEHYHYLTKNKDNATSFVHLDQTAETGVKIITKLQDPNHTHKYSMKSAIKEINTRLKKEKIDFNMNQYAFNLFNNVYGIKDNEKYCYTHTQYKKPIHTYSIHAIEFIYNEIAKDSQNIIENLKSRVKRKKQQSTPGAKDS